MRNAPSRREVGPGVESYASARLRAIGKTMPPARALFDGTIVARTASVETRAYDRPNERLPMARMNRNARRRPSPVLSTPRAMKNAHSTSQTMGSAYPRSDSAGVIVPVTAMAQTPRNTMAPAESGCTMDPMIVAAKIANSRHEVAVMPSGGPNARITPAVANTAAQRQIRSGGVEGCGSPGTPGAAAGVGMRKIADGGREAGDGCHRKVQSAKQLPAPAQARSITPSKQQSARSRPCIAKPSWLGLCRSEERRVG